MGQKICKCAKKNDKMEDQQTIGMLQEQIAKLEEERGLMEQMVAKKEEENRELKEQMAKLKEEKRELEEHIEKIAQCPCPIVAPESQQINAKTNPNNNNNSATPGNDNAGSGPSNSNLLAGAAEMDDNWRSDGNFSIGLRQYSSKVEQRGVRSNQYQRYAFNNDGRSDRDDCWRSLPIEEWDEHFVDLHGMDSKSAMELIKDKIELYQKRSNCRAINAITGYGKTRNEPSIIRAQLIQFLEKNNITYAIPPTNPGVLEISLREIRK